MKQILLTLLKRSLLLTLLMCSAISAHAIELMTWDRLPLAVPLIVGQERVIFVERNVRIGVPGSLSGKLRIQSTGGNVYLLATEPIDPTRIQLQDAETGELILMDIAASLPESDKQTLEPIQIIEGIRKPVRYGSTAYGNAAYGNTNMQNSVSQGNVNETSGYLASQQSRETPVPVILTRYAAQNLYAPLRTVEPVTGISRVNLRRDIDLKNLLPILPVKATAMAAWRLDDYFVTAVRLQNTSHQTIILDPRLLQGNFIAATFQHQTLGFKGDSTDTTVLYLITKKYGLPQSLLPAINPITPQNNVRNLSNDRNIRLDSDKLSGGDHEK